MVRLGATAALVWLLWRNTSVYSQSIPSVLSINERNALRKLPQVDLQRSSTLDISSLAPLHVDGGSQERQTGLWYKTTLLIVLETAFLYGVFWSCRAVEPIVGSWLEQTVGLSTTNEGIPLLQWFAIAFLVSCSKLVHASIRNTLLSPPKTAQRRKLWYKKLAKPWYHPPAWFFPLAWIVVCKSTQLYGLSTLLHSTQSILPFCVSISFGDAWHSLFYAYQRIGVALVAMLGFWTTALGCAYYSPWMIPTALWVTVVGLINVELYRMNRV